ncbi:MAG TPA: hypothetical protein VED41_06455, partial [Solirubrobacteraceae bacterium]|nr:hypothetical protein [Solirubrobacteraceae bacterium]
GGPAPIPQPQVTRVRQRVTAEEPPAAREEPAAASGGEAQAKAPGMFRRLLGRLRGRGGDGGRADG